MVLVFAIVFILATCSILYVLFPAHHILKALYSLNINRYKVLFFEI